MRVFLFPKIKNEVFYTFLKYFYPHNQVYSNRIHYLRKDLYTKRK